MTRGKRGQLIFTKEPDVHGLGGRMWLTPRGLYKKHRMVQMDFLLAIPAV